MEFFEVVSSRHSYRGPFTAEPVPQEDLRRIVEAGIKAPSGMNQQTTTFVVVDDPALLKQIAALAPDNKALNTCQALIALVMDGPDDAGRPPIVGVEDYAVAAGYMLLAITALGYASVWLQGMLGRPENAQAIGELLGVPAQKSVRVMLPLGRPAEPLSDRGRKTFDERARWNGW
jgi:nitroreductase